MRRSAKPLTVGELIAFVESLCLPSAIGLPEHGETFWSGIFSGVSWSSVGTLHQPLSREGWVPCLQVGAPTDVVEQIYLVPFLSDEFLAHCTSRRKTLIVSATPLFTKPVCFFHWNSWPDQQLAQLLKKRIALYALPESYAASANGFEDCLASILGFSTASPLVPLGTEPQFKLVVFVPPPFVSKVLNAAAQAGAGVIGEYSHCSFQLHGKGTFLPSERANPTIGKRRHFEEVEEVRLEMVVPQSALQTVITRVIDVHPYEEVAYDVYPLSNAGPIYGHGRLAVLEHPMDFKELLQHIEHTLDLGTAYRLRYTLLGKMQVTRIAIGIGTDRARKALWRAAREQEVDVLIINGASAADWAEPQPPVCVDIGFVPAITPGMQRLAERLRQVFEHRGVKIECAT